VTIEPLRFEFEVDCPAAHAFEVWTHQISRWWPADHTVSAEPGLHVILEPFVRGRIYERTAHGVEHDWGEITVWEPPRRLVYLWHLRTDRVDATEVEIRFIVQGTARVRVEIEHRGWERLGERGPAWRERNYGGWSTLFPHYLAALRGGPDHA
jgi:uncharacterized protein YndB with AHSA1/START domain